MNYEDLPENVRKFRHFCLEELDAPSTLHIENHEILWERSTSELMDWMEAQAAKKLFDLEIVDAEEINLGFGFRATSRDGTVWKSMPLDCHKITPGEKVGRFPDASGRLVIVRKKQDSQSRHIDF